MMAEAARHNPLDSYAEKFLALEKATNAALSIREQSFATQLDLRLSPDLPDSLDRIAEALGFALPMTPNTVSGAPERRALWLGPDEWLIVSDREDDQLWPSLAHSIGGAFAALVDVSAQRTVFEVGGSEGAALLARLVAIDLHPRAFPVARCAQTLLAGMPVIIERRSGRPSLHLYVRVTFASAVADWLLDAVEATPRAQE